jgi:hypothetical protein
VCTIARSSECGDAVADAEAWFSDFQLSLWRLTILTYQRKNCAEVACTAAAEKKPFEPNKSMFFTTVSDFPPVHSPTYELETHRSHEAKPPNHRPSNQTPMAMQLWLSQDSVFYSSSFSRRRPPRSHLRTSLSVNLPCRPSNSRPGRLHAFSTAY